MVLCLGLCHWIACAQAERPADLGGAEAPPATAEDDETQVDDFGGDFGGSLDEDTEASLETGESGALDTVPKFDIGPPPDIGHTGRDCNIDFLFVVDNSASMAREQGNLARAVPQFIATLEQEIDELRSFHLGVVTSDAYAANPEGCGVHGGFIVQTNGTDSSAATCGPYAEGHNYMTDADDLNAAFACAARPGTEGHGDEMPMKAMQRAISPHLGAADACNAGFVRDNAVLFITIVTDEEDDDESTHLPIPGPGLGSGGSPQTWYESVMRAKHGELERVVVLGLLGGPSPNACDQTWTPGEHPGTQMGEGAESSPRLAEFVRLFGERGFVEDICAEDYGPFFARATEVIDFACNDLPEGRH